MKHFAFAGRVCLITGAASGIGAALTANLAARRAILVLVDRDADGLAKVAAQARELGAKVADEHVIDLADGGDRLDFAAAVQSRHGGVDLLVNNAGVGLSGTFEQNAMADVDWLLEVNLRAPIRLTKAFLPQLLRRPGGHVVAISSIFGVLAPAGQVAYATSKFGLRGFAEALRHELRPRGAGVTVVHPGGIRTNIATSSRISGPDTDGVQAAELHRFTEAALRLPPEEAARQIVAAVRSRKRRLVITGEAKAMDALVRLLPARYWEIAERVASRSGRIGGGPGRSSS